MKKYAVIVAGGSGSRMGGNLPKQFMLIHGKPLLAYTIGAFLRAYADLEIIIVLPAGFDNEGRVATGTIQSERLIQFVPGGASRFQSVKNGLSLVKESSVVFVHDAVRCMVTEELIRRCFEKCVRQGSAIPCIDSQDSLRFIHASGNQAVKRTDIKLLQTPQTFKSEIILASYLRDYQDDFTDCASVVEAAGFPIHLVEGEVNNIKITTPLDLLIAEQLLKFS
jgi:2-C-methyl-D-erythritol 4-phosphate cytidylyltransferase